MTDDEQFEVVYNGSNFNLRNNDNHEELRLTDERACYDYICDLLNLRNETIQSLEEENNRLIEENKMLKITVGRNEAYITRLKNECELSNTGQYHHDDDAVEWLRNNTVWTQMPSSKRTYTKTE